MHAKFLVFLIHGLMERHNSKTIRLKLKENAKIVAQQDGVKSMKLCW